MNDILLDSSVETIKSKKYISDGQNGTQRISLEQVKSVFGYYLNKEITKVDLLAWVNYVWFSDKVEYEEKDHQKIADTLHQLEQLDETDQGEDIIDRVNAILK